MAYQQFETELSVRPDDIDMNNHVHSAKYLDYVLFARYDQMERCYGMPMSEFIENGWGWVLKSVSIDFKRPLVVTDKVIVRTWLDSFARSDAKVMFQIIKKSTMKIAADGHIMNTMVNLATGRGVDIPEWVIMRYTKGREER